MIKLKKHVRIALGYFLVAATLGILLRLAFTVYIPVNFRYVVHAHSHIALLGWVYVALITLIYCMYFTEVERSKTYRRIFWFTNLTLVGMLFTFPFTGYALFSILFSTLFLIASYYQVWFFLKYIPKHYKSTFSFRCIKASLIYLLISSLGPWAIGGVMASLGNTSIWYKLSIYFYLHFQYNAWFILALCGVFFYTLERAKIHIPPGTFQRFFLLSNLGIVLSLFLSALWTDPPVPVYLLAGAGAVVQTAAFYKLFQLAVPAWSSLKKGLAPLARTLLKISGIFLLIKVLMQLATAIPYIARLAFLYTDFVIGYLHLVFLGLISMALFAFLIHFRLLKFNKGIFWLYFTGFALSELLIFYRGTSIWLGLPLFPENVKILLAVSALMPISLGWLLVKNLKFHRRPHPPG